MKTSIESAEFEYGGKTYFNRDVALALMLMNGVVFVHSFWWKEKESKWTKEEANYTSISVNCNDIFAWGCADSEPLPCDEIEKVYKIWKNDESWGTAKWCAIKRNMKPQLPVIELMKREGAWDEVMENLGPNPGEV